MSSDAPERTRHTAGDRAAAVAAVQDGGRVDYVALEHGVSPATLRRWLVRARGAEAAGYVATAALADRPRTGRPPVAWSRKGAEEAYGLWEKLYLQPEAPTAAGCLRTVERVGATRGWKLPNAKVFLQRLRTTKSPGELARARGGRMAALETYPFQSRTIQGLKPLDVVNGDGYRHCLWVLPPDGDSEKTFRPLTWFWADVRTRRILAWRSGPTESSDLVRLSFHDMATAIGVPGAVLQDNTRAASTKWFAGSSLRWRKDREPVFGILKDLGVRPMRTGVEHEDNGKARGRGWAKPIERAFQDVGNEVDKHPRAAGAYTGPSPLEKPSNYDKANALPWETFQAIVADGVAQDNARPGRRTEAAAGRSFDETWEAEIATTPVRRLTRAQEALLLLAAESTRVQKSGIFQLKVDRAPGVPRNDYWHEDLAAFAGERVVARFDPDDLHGHVEVFDLEGKWLCRAECRLPVGFTDTDGARRHARARRRYLAGLDKANAANKDLQQVLDDYGLDLPAAAAPKRRSQKVVAITPQASGRPDTERRRALQAKLDRGLKRVAERDG